MKGDFSRLRFQPKQHYTSVLQQQGRVQLDSDGNEQRAIDEHLRRTEERDVIGAEGAPIHAAGFAVTVDPKAGLLIGAGRYYIDGLLCENEAELAYNAQPYLVGALPPIAALLADLRAGRSTAIEIWLEAWQRLAIPIDDPCLREPALGEADTTARRQTVWRVYANPIPATPPTLTNVPGAIETIDCCTRMRRAITLHPTPGKLAARTSDDPSQGSCLPSPNAAYRGLENQLYRVEIQRGGAAAETTFKWSRENGSVVTRITAMHGATLTVESLGRDANLGFAPEQWVEVGDDSDEFGSPPNQPGALARVKTTDPAHSTITLYQTPPSVNADSGHAKLRRWDQTSAAATPNGLACTPGTWIELENGVEVLFSADGTYAPGDHWLIPARTATGDVEWPPCGSDGALSQPPFQTTIYRTPLACLHRNSDRVIVPEDCRIFFRPLNELGAALTPTAIHVTGVSWINDDVMSLDFFLLKGLSLTFDSAPASPLDARNVLVTLEVPVPADEIRRAAGQGAVRSPLIVDGVTQLSSLSLAWTAPQNAWAYIDQALNATLSLASDSGLPLTRARITLKSRAIAQGSGPTAIYLDGQSFTTPDTRADKTPRLDLVLPSGNDAKASDFESWFYVAPVLLISDFTIAPASVALVRDSSGANKVVDNTSNQPNPSAAAVQPTGAITLNYAVLADTVLNLSLVNNAAQKILQFPATLTFKKGTAQQSFPINVVGNPGATATKFDLSAAIPFASGFTTSRTAEITVIGFANPVLTAVPGLFNPTPKPGE